jgi:hypothetical protein
MRAYNFHDQVLYMAIILSENYQLLLPVGLVIEFIHVTQLTAPRCSWEARGNKLHLSDTKSLIYRIFRVNMHYNQDKHHKEVTEMTWNTLLLLYYNMAEIIHHLLNSFSTADYE